MAKRLSPFRFLAVLGFLTLFLSESLVKLAHLPLPTAQKYWF
jgi:hypothetical protein